MRFYEKFKGFVWLGGKACQRKLTFQVDGPITRRAYIRGEPEHFLCLQVDGPITGRGAYNRGGGLITGEGGL